MTQKIPFLSSALIAVRRQIHRVTRWRQKGHNRPALERRGRSLSGRTATQAPLGTVAAAANGLVCTLGQAGESFRIPTGRFSELRAGVLNLYGTFCQEVPVVILPELVSGRWQTLKATDGGLWADTGACEHPSTTRCAGGPPPRDKLGEDFGAHLPVGDPAISNDARVRFVYR